MPRTIWHGETGRHTHRAVTESAAVKDLASALETQNGVVGSHGGVVTVAGCTSAPRANRPGKS